MSGLGCQVVTCFEAVSVSGCHERRVWCFDRRGRWILRVCILTQIQEISNRTHVSRTQKKPGYLIARSQLTERGPLGRSHSIFDGPNNHVFFLIKDFLFNKSTLPVFCQHINIINPALPRDACRRKSLPFTTELQVFGISQVSVQWLITMVIVSPLRMWLFPL